ncbi:MAG TPA: hypothetical protein VKV40_05625 [Ktedonobacteraceae bacterium]|nr:hypothetical protein [Ktedonobacteraceae bacterium]
MSSHRPPTSTRASWKANNGGQHPSDDLLLTYVRRQHLDNLIEIEQHVAACSTCQGKCNEFQQSSRLISAWAQDKGLQFYPTITNTVMQKIVLESKLSPRKRMSGRLRQGYKYSLLEAVVQRIMGQEEARSRRQATDGYVSPLSPLTDEPLPGPFAELQKHPLPGEGQRPGTGRSRRARFTNRSIIALVAVAAIITFLIIGVVASPGVRTSIGGHSYSKGTAVTIPPHDYTSTPAKTKTPVTRTGSASDPTPTDIGTEPKIWLCSTQGEEKHYIIEICGSYFTPGHRVWLAAYGSDNITLPRTANSSGDIDITLSAVDGCHSVPLFITVLDEGSQKVAVLSNITLSSCPSKHH